LPGPPSRSAGSGSGAAKRLDRQVAGFDEQEWARRRLGIVVTGDLAKFGRHPGLLDFLLATGGQALAEAAPNDRIGGHRPGRYRRARRIARALARAEPARLRADGGPAPARRAGAAAASIDRGGRRCC
jgi:hypothetical protein